MDIRNTITRFGATALIGCGLVVTAIPATFAQNDGETVTHEYQDRAASHISEVWYKGETLEISGEGFLTQDRASGSTIAIKLNKGAIKIDGKDYLEVTANDKGEFTVSIPWQSGLEDRVSVDVYLLSGSLAENDNVRGGVAVEYTFSTENQVPAPKVSEPKASESANAPVTNPSAAPSAPADSKEQAKDQSKAPVDSLKSEAQKKDSTAPKTSGSLSQNVTSSTNGSASSNSSKSSLANTGASGVVIAAGIGVLALVVGATVLVARRRKA